ncbi:MAG: ATP-binding cassette domain-containing protein [Bacteroidetes Order II. Incertae sedis bacterium]|nr:ATP-binding cassette domain-containing protein [Bacteroidetes Order II. bacterium]
MIEVLSLSKRYGSDLAVQDLSFTIPKGQVLGFLGPNGAGKTTTMKMLTCFLPPTSGDAQINGLSILEHGLQIRQQIGYLPEQNPLYEDMNVFDYLHYTARMRGVEKTAVRSCVIEYAGRCGLKEVLHKQIGTLSKGFKQRVGLAQALLHDPAILVLDEPTSGLDPNQKGEILDLIRHLGDEKTVILSTHILSEVEAICERALIISGGKLVADGSMAELKTAFSGGQRIRLGILNGITEKVLPAFGAVGGLTVQETAWQGNTLLLTLTYESDAEIRPELFRLAVDQEWILTELYREKVNLEDVFRQVTTL